MTRLTGIAWLPRSDLTPISSVKHLMCSCEKAASLVTEISVSMAEISE